MEDILKNFAYESPIKIGSSDGVEKAREGQTSVEKI